VSQKGMRFHWLVAAPIASIVSALALEPPPLDIPKETEVGVYITRGSEWREVEAQSVSWKTGGMAKRVAPEGTVRENRNGTIPGRLSSTAFPADAKLEVLIHSAEGALGDGYRLVRLHPRSGAREFCFETPGIFNFADNASRDIVPFRAERAGAQLWRVELSGLEEGQYGFLPPVKDGSEAGDNDTTGKMYSFDIVCEECDTSRSKGRLSRIVPVEAIRRKIQGLNAKDPVFRF
jgi:hypothetical protein